MDGQPLSPAQLDKLRKTAVTLRLQKKSLNEIQLHTGLSHPTIISAYKKFLKGGWQALQSQQRGRPSGSQHIKQPALAPLFTLLLSEPYPAIPTTSALWDISSVHQWIANQQATSTSEKTTSRYLKKIGLLPANESLDFSRKAVFQAIRKLPITEIQQPPNNKDKRALFIVGTRRFLVDNETEQTGYQAYARDTKNRIQWTHSHRALETSDLIGFLNRLHAQQTNGIIVVIKVPFYHRFPELHQWQNDHPDSLLIPSEHLAIRQSTNLLNESDPASAQPKTDSHYSQHSTPGKDMPLTHLQRLEAESIQIMREVVAETENPVMLYSIGKDSAVMLHIAMKAFYPSLPPFPLLHVDTRWKFQEMYRFRDKMVEDLGLKLITHINPEAIEKDINPFTHGSAIHTDITKTEGLKQALNQYGFDAAFGGARRDEEKSRAKERIFSFRTADHRWDPKSQRPELWKQYNARKHKGESIRVFPISNWTELDIWQYIHLENIPIVPLYYSAERPVVERDGTLIMVDDERMPLRDGEVPMMKKVRFRTLGCYPLTGAVESEADTLPAIIQEMLLTNTSERQGRMIDHDSAASMEKKKQEGYF